MLGFNLSCGKDFRVSGFNGDLVYKLKKIVDYSNFSAQFVGVISHFRVIGCGINVFQQADCLVAKATFVC